MASTDTLTFEGRTAEEWRNEASRSYKNAADSWDRSDTDGFMTQWASQTIAREYELKAELAEKGGKWEFHQLFDLEGNRIHAENVEGAYGPVWRVYDPETHETVRWINESNARKGSTRMANNAKKGFALGLVRAAAHVRSGGNAVTVTYYPAPNDRYMADAEVVDAALILEDF